MPQLPQSVSPDQLPPEDAAIVGGLPPDGSGYEGTEVHPAVEPEVTPTLPQPIFVGGRKFNSQAELDAYFSRQEGMIEGMQRQPAPQYQPAAAPIPRVSPEQILFEDPKTALQMVKAEAAQEIRQEINQERARVEAWAKFYRMNPDLVGYEGLVEGTSAGMQSEIANLPLDQSMVKLANKTRQYLSQARGNRPSANEVTLAPGQARTAGASRATVAPMKAPPVIPKTFSEQVKDWQMSKRKKA